MKTLEDRLDATCRISDAERRRLIAAINEADGAADGDPMGDPMREDTQPGYVLKRWSEPVTDSTTRDNQPSAAVSATRRWGRSYVRELREQDFVGSNCRPAMAGWFVFLSACLRMVMPRRRRTMRKRVGIIVDQPILDLLGITLETELDLLTDGPSLVITPHGVTEMGGSRTEELQARTLKTAAGTFRKLAW